MPNFFDIIPNSGSSGACPQKMSQIRQKLTICWPKQSSMFEKVKPHRARIPFWKSVKTCPKWFAVPNFFDIIPNYSSSGACPQKMSQIRQKLTICWPKQSSVFEKVKPHRARILFWKIGKNVSKMVRYAQFFWYYPQLWLKWSMPTKNEPNRTKIDDLVTKTKFGYRKRLSLIERGYFFEKSVKRCPKWFAMPNFFDIIPNYGSSGACPQKMSQIRQKLTICWPKQSSMFEKVKPHRARILFWKLVKTCPKWFAVPNFFDIIPNYSSSGACPQKMSQIRKKLTICWPKQSSMFEKVKPHRERILFWKSVKTCLKWFAMPNFFNIFPNYGSSGACPQKMSQIGQKLTIWWPKQSSVIEKG